MLSLIFATVMRKLFSSWALKENWMLPDKDKSTVSKNIAPSKAELEIFRQKLGISDNQHTIGIAKTDIPSLMCPVRV